MPNVPEWMTSLASVISAVMSLGIAVFAWLSAREARKAQTSAGHPDVNRITAEHTKQIQAITRGWQAAMRAPGGTP
jgi:hypothetical protein